MPLDPSASVQNKPEPPKTVAMSGGSAAEYPETRVGPPPESRPLLSQDAVISGYTVVSLLGRGGMGQVYLVRDHKLERDVALKMLGGWAAAEPRLFERFQTEIKSVARLSHPNIAQVYEAGESQGQPYFTMEYLPGGSLAELLAGKPLRPRLAAELVECLARAMHYAHQQGVLHRDLKPANIIFAVAAAEPAVASGNVNTSLLTGDNRQFPSTPKIADFGLAKRLDNPSGSTLPGEILGTPSYMAPEQASGVATSLGPECDVYQLGAILYECLTGRPPFLGPDSFSTAMQVMTTEPVPPRSVQPGVPRDLEIICLKCLAKQPAKRYRTAQALADDLRCFLDEKTISARPAAWPERLIKWCRRRPALAAGILFTILAAAGVVAGALYWQADAQRRRAQAEQMLNLALQSRNRIESGSYLESSGRRTEAQEEFRQAIANLSEIEAAYTIPEIRTQLARTHHLLGLALHNAEDVKRRSGQEADYSAAMAEYVRSIDIWKKQLDAGKAPPDARREMGRTLNNLGNCLRDTRQYEDAQLRYRQSQEVLERHIRAEPGDAEAYSLLGLVFRNEIRAQLDRGELATDGEKRLRAALEYHQTAQKLDPNGSGYADRLAWTQHVLCQHLMRAGETPRAAKELAVLRERLAQLTASARVEEQRNAAWLCAEMAEFVMQHPHLDDATRETALSTYATAAAAFLEDMAATRPEAAHDFLNDERMAALRARPELAAAARAIEKVKKP